MASFLEKLKKGMANESAGAQSAAIEEPAPQEESGIEPASGDAVLAGYKNLPPKKGIPSFEEPAPKPRSGLRGRPKKMITRIEQLEEPQEQEEEERLAAGNIPGTPAKPIKKPVKKPMAKKTSPSADDKKNQEWLNGEAQLVVNVYQTENDLVIQSAIAGVRVEDLDVLIEEDLVTIKGNRPNPIQENGDYFIEECYWGQFSRKIILPVEVDSSRADAAMKDGILTIRIPKIQREKKKKVLVKQ